MLTTNDLNRVEEIVNRVVNKVVDRKISGLENKVIRKINIIISHFEGEDLNIEKRVERIEKHLNLNN
ncbi:hypothetical protein A3F29_03120 [Candidatus Roizmanbacteria bacterium RIFCSPHIGHO2_12_FULL_33_9]|uniref:Uncharacterized protein n=1 Tax=Candidatus Roizmanbacteria bacterium RIFCSPHIGHO2_12_FULL_33_9 TaxID=1802045 RepID=A0A1F7HEU3_9BACT|nr:MAG: hypothetical protein A3F29_03120 [Candidatus Roizmanbacteria bacterium RIFCSPHIGHO2_12_FULL_33_9]